MPRENKPSHILEAGGFALRIASEDGTGIVLVEALEGESATVFRVGANRDGDVVKVGGAVSCPASELRPLGAISEDGKKIDRHFRSSRRA
jgi:hypothetical protein